jgi:uncharacterized protein YegL
MAYDIPATSRTPALIIYVIDISGSMEEHLDGQKKIDHVHRAFGRILQKMVQRSTKGEIVSPRYRLGLIAYSDKPIDVYNGIQTITEVVAKGRPAFTAAESTNTYGALKMARNLLESEMPNQKGRPAPMVCHLTDGEFTDNDPEPIAREIMSMSTSDGPVLVENIYVGTDLLTVPIANVESWLGIQNEKEIKDPYAKKLFRMSSPLPEGYYANIEKEGYSLKPGSRMLLPGSNHKLIELGFAASGATTTR